MLLGDKRRVELNAMTNDQIVNFVRLKLREHGVKKVVPGKLHLEDAYRRAIYAREVNAAAERAHEAALEVSAQVRPPAGLEKRVRRMLKESPKLSWDSAVARIARAGNDDDIPE